VCDHPEVAQFCCITYPDRTGYNTMAASLFDAAVKALEWSEIHCRSFGTARRYRDDEVLVIAPGMVPTREYRVRIGRARDWERQQQCSE
jgi:hypothetical protein